MKEMVFGIAGTLSILKNGIFDDFDFLPHLIPWENRRHKNLKVIKKTLNLQKPKKAALKKAFFLKRALK